MSNESNNEMANEMKMLAVMSMKWQCLAIMANNGVM
jgi:hypothetical protein